MKLSPDVQALADAASDQRGVFDKADLRVLLGERHPTSLTRRINALIDAGELRRFSRGVYVRDPFDLPTLSQRLCADSYISFGNALARHLVIGTTPAHQVLSAKAGPTRTYTGLGFEIVHLHVGDELNFAYSPIDGVRWADAEKAALDALYFHLRGRRYPFDVYSDIDTSLLDNDRLEEYLARYRNPKFVAFARNTLQLT